MKGLGGTTYRGPWLLLCEGDSDRMLFTKLVAAKGLEDKFEVRFPGQELADSGGKGKFGAYLGSAVEAPTFISNVKAALIVADADDGERDANIAEIATTLTKKGLVPPAKEGIPVRGLPWLVLVVLILVPFKEKGNLETVALPAAYDKWPMKPALDTFVAASPATGWRPGLQSRMRMQSIIAANCEEMPNCGFKHLWQRDPKYHLDMNHKCFDEVTVFLKDFEALIATV